VPVVIVLGDHVMLLLLSTRGVTTSECTCMMLLFPRPRHVTLAAYA